MIIRPSHRLRTHPAAVTLKRQPDAPLSDRALRQEHEAVFLRAMQQTVNDLRALASQLNHAVSNIDTDLRGENLE